MFDEHYLLDMLLSARKVANFVEGIDEAAFRASELHQWAIVKQIEIIGEAASRVSEEFRKSHPAIPWPRIIGMRHRLVHDYRNVDLQLVWETATVHAPALIPRLEPLIPPDPEADGDT